MKKRKVEADIFKDMPRGVPARDMEKRVGYELFQVPNAQWMDDKVIKERFAYQDDQILIGSLGKNLIGIKDDRHIMTIAGSRSGKSVHIANNLIHYKGSCLVIDPKGDLANITAERRNKELGQEVYILDPFKKVRKELNEYQSSFNPLSILDFDNPTILEDAGLIADALVIGSDRGDPHWDETARSFIEGVILHVATTWNLSGTRDLVTVYNLLTKGEDIEEEEDDDEDRGVLKNLIADMIDNAKEIKERGKVDETDYDYISDAIEAAATEFRDRPKGERGSVLSTIRRHIKFLGYQSLQSVLEVHDFDLSALKTASKGMTIYLCLPAGRMGTCNRWLRLFVNLALEAMEREQTKPELPVLICLDEFPILGYMKQLEDAAGLLAGFGVKLWPILQDLGQLKALYKERWETFMGNAGVIQFFGNNDITTLEYIQKRVGKAAIKMERQSEKPGDARKQGQNTTPHIEHHHLVTLEEAARYFGRDDPLKRQLIIVGGELPMILQRVEFYDPEGPCSSYFKGKFYAG